MIGIPADRRMLGAHPFHAVGEKYILAVTEAAGGLPFLIPSLGDRLDIGQVIEVGKALEKLVPEWTETYDRCVRPAVEAGRKAWSGATYATAPRGSKYPAAYGYPDVSTAGSPGSGTYTPRSERTRDHYRFADDSDDPAERWTADAYRDYEFAEGGGSTYDPDAPNDDLAWAIDLYEPSDFVTAIAMYCDDELEEITEAEAVSMLESREEDKAYYAMACLYRQYTDDDLEDMDRQGDPAAKAEKWRRYYSAFAADKDVPEDVEVEVVTEVAK